MTTTSPPKARPGLPPATTAQLVLGGLLLAHLAVVEVAFFTVRRGQERDAHRGEVLRAARRDADDAAADPDRPAAVPGPPPRHGPAHPLAPLGRLHPVLDGADARLDRRARLRPARQRAAAQDVPRAGRGGRVAARHDRRDDHRRHRRDVRQVPAAADVLRGLARHPHGRLPRDLRRAHAPVPRRHHVLQPVGAGLLVDGVGAGDRRAGRGPGGHPVAPQRAARVPRGGRRPGRRRTPPRCTSRAATSTSCPPARASSASGASPTTTAGGRPTRSRSRPRPTAAPAAHREGRRHDQRRAARPPARQPGVRRGPVRRVHRACTRWPRACCSSRAAWASRRSARCWRSRPCRRSCSTACRTSATPCCCASCRSCAGSAGRGCRCWPGAPGRATRRSRRSSPTQLAALVPDITRRDVYVCGPAAMTESVLRSLQGAEGAPRADPRGALQPRLIAGEPQLGQPRPVAAHSGELDVLVAAHQVGGLRGGDGRGVRVRA